MNLRNRIVTALTTTVLAGSLVIGAQAQTADIDTAAVEILRGTFTASIEAQDFAAANYSFEDQQVASTGLVLSITNKTGSPAGWHVTTTATDYIGVERAGESIPFANTAVSGTTNLVSEAGMETTGVQQATNMAAGGTDSPILSVSAEAGSGQGQYALSISELTLTIPAGTLAQTYRSTLTVSIPTAP